MHVTRGCVTSKTASPILLQLVDHDGALRATMATKVSLPIAVQVEPARRGRGEGAPGGVPQSPAVAALKQKAAGEVISNRLMPAENFGAPGRI